MVKDQKFVVLDGFD